MMIFMEVNEQSENLVCSLAFRWSERNQFCNIRTCQILRHLIILHCFQSGMNLQICFMNETVSDQEAALSDHDAEQTLKMAHHPPSYEKVK